MQQTCEHVQTCETILTVYVPPTRSQINATMQELQSDVKRLGAFKMRCDKEKNMHRDYATYMVDWIIDLLQPHFKTELVGTLFVCDYNHPALSFTYVTSATIVEAIAKHAYMAILVSHEDGSHYELTYNPNAIITVKENIKWEERTYGWMILKPDTLMGPEELTGAQIASIVSTRAFRRPLDPTVPAAPLFKYLHSPP